MSTTEFMIVAALTAELGGERLARRRVPRLDRSLSVDDRRSPAHATLTR